ncbi:MAG TPA: glucoamylase family protein [Acidobacteriaceae bacterium]
MDRRVLLKLLSASAVMQSWPILASASSPSASILTAADEALLDDIQRRGCLYFIEQASPHTGEVLDRARWVNSKGALDSRRMASIAATGFGLSALCIADKRGWQPAARVLEQVRRTLRFHCDTLPNQHGFFAHFNDLETGKAWDNTEISSIDTALLLCGVLTARAHFHADAEVVRLATTIYERIDWPWMLNGERTFSMGLRGGEFLKSRWNHYSELMMLYLLALGSPTHPIDPACWDAWSRPRMQYAGFDYIGAADPLFVHQYSHAWFDFRNQQDHYADYFANSILATRAHEAFCLDLGKPYSPNYWGISASDSQHGYTSWGGPGSRDGKEKGFGGIDGSVVPYATAGSLPFLPAQSLRVLHSLKDRYSKYAWGRYGFCDAFHPDAQWYDPDVLGIDLGIGVLMAENLRSGFVWETFARNPEAAVAMRRAGFHAV